MKKILYIALLMMGFLSSCSNDVIDDLSGKYDYIDRLNLTSAQVGTTGKLKKGIKCLKVDFTDAQGNKVNLAVASAEWVLGKGEYTPVPEIANPATAGTYAATITSGGAVKKVDAGNIQVNLLGEVYYISGMVYSGSDSFVINYKGSLTFEIGVDEPEASGYTAHLSVAPVTITDYTTWQTTVIPGVQKYGFAITDPEGRDVAFFEAVNAENLAPEALGGTYTIAGNVTEPFLIDNGWMVPDYVMAGGAYITSSTGEKQYITAGQITFSFNKLEDGTVLASFAGQGLTFGTMTGAAGTVDLNVKFATVSK